MLETDKDIASTIERVEPNLTDRIAILSGMMGIKEHTGRFKDRLVWVTDLINPKKAYYREKFPELAKEVPFERRELMWAGTEFHYEFGRAVSQEVYREQRVGFRSIIGAIDIFKDHPVELKWTRDITSRSDILKGRPENVEQLGMYCAMTNVPFGRLVYYIHEGDEPGRVLAFDLKFDDLKSVRDVMIARKDLLLEAWETDNPSVLPGCPWYGKGCECEKKCDCGKKCICGASKTLDQSIARMVSECKYDPEESKRLTRVFNAYTSAPRAKLSTWDLMTPRKWWFNKHVKGEEGFEDDNGDTVAASAKQDWKTARRGIEDQIKHCSGIEYALEFAELEGERVPVEMLRKVPVVITQPNFKDPLPPDVGKMARYWRDDILRLGMQCALAEKKTGKLVAYYHNVEDVDAKLVVYMVHFRDTKPYLDLMGGNLRLIREAILNREFVGLPRCPEFKCQYKEHRCKWIGECRG